MPLQRLTMSSDYSQRPINPLPLPYKRQPPSAMLIASTRPTTPAHSMPMFINSPLLRSTRKPHPLRPRTIGDELERRLESYGYYDDALKFNFKTRKFADFSAGEEVTMGRGTAPTLCSQYRQAILRSPNDHVALPDFLLPAQAISQSVGQPTTPNSEDHNTSLTFQNPAALSAQAESNAPVSNWRQALISSCVVGVALVGVATGYACATVFRGALNVGQFVYTNRGSIQQTATTCTLAVQSTYNAAKRRMISIPVPRLPVGMRRRYAAPPTPHARSWRRRLFRQSGGPLQSPAQSSQPINPVVSSLAPDGMPGVEYSGLSNIGQFPDTQDAADPDAFIYPQSSNALASDAPYMTGGLFYEPTPPPPPSPSPAQDQPASDNLAGSPTSDDIELTEPPCICYAESVFSEDFVDEYVAEDGDEAKVPTTELFEDDGGHMGLQEDFWFLPGQFEPHLPRRASVPTSASPVIETAPQTVEAPAPVIEHASPSPSPSPTIEPGSPLPSPPGAFPLPPPLPGRPTLSPHSPTKAIARQEGAKKSRKRKTAPGANNKMAKSQKNPPPAPPQTRKASSPPKDVRRSNRIAGLKK